MNEQAKDLTSIIQELREQMAGMQAEINRLKEQIQALPQPRLSSGWPSTSTRRTILKRLGLTLLGGAAAATVLGSTSVAQAKLTTNLNLSNGSRTGALVVTPGAPPPTGNPPSNNNYGLIATANTTALDLSSLSGSSGLVGFGDSGVYGSGYYGVFGKGSGYGVYAQGAYGVYGVSNSFRGVWGSGAEIGVYGESPSIGVEGSGDGAGGAFASKIYIDNKLPASTHVGVLGVAGVDGIFDQSTFSTNFRIGVYGYTNATTPNSYAGFFDGNVTVTGYLYKTSGAFKIDHPLDPANKYLYHSFVESPDMKNIYDGVVTLDEQGTATLEMPTWFEALNTDFRYQLTPVG